MLVSAGFISARRRELELLARACVPGILLASISLFLTWCFSLKDIKATQKIIVNGMFQLRCKAPVLIAVANLQSARRLSVRTSLTLV